MKKNIALCFLLLLCNLVHAQFNVQAWRGKKCAVVLTYDDALNVHLDNAIPLLDSLGMKGTFYLTINSPGFKLRMDDWRQAANKGNL